MSSTQIFRPTPRRPTKLELSQQPSTPLLTPNTSSELPSRTQSALNLTSSTLLGIFSPSCYDPEHDSTSFASTQPSRPNHTLQNEPVKPNYQSRPPKKTKYSEFFLRVLLLFGTGMGYGFLIQHLFDQPQSGSILFNFIADHKFQWTYLLTWGICGVALGSLLPLMDKFFSIDKDTSQGSVVSSVPTTNKKSETKKFGIFNQDWTPVIRSVGAFVGITYALRKLAWTSNFQASLALSFVNPVIWYLIDRSKPGFLLSAFVGVIGTALLLFLKFKLMMVINLRTPLIIRNLNLIHNEIEQQAILLHFIDKESLEDSIWILSILFCSSMCFGAVGRKLALSAM